MEENFSVLPQSRLLTSVFPIYAVDDGGGDCTEDLGSLLSLYLRRRAPFVHHMTAHHDPLNTLLFACVTLLVP